MINLLDTETQRHYRAARLNLKLRSYLTTILVTLLLIVIFFGGGIFITRAERAAAEAELQSGQASLAQYSDVKKQSEDFTSNLKIAKSILSQEVLYSDMLVRIAKTLPNSAVLTTLTLDQTTLQKPIVLAGRVRTKDDAVILKNALEESPMFEGVNLNNITEQPPSPTDTGLARDYPVTVTLSMQATKGQPGSLLP